MDEGLQTLIEQLRSEDRSSLTNALGKLWEQGRFKDGTFVGQNLRGVS